MNALFGLALEFSVRTFALALLAWTLLTALRIRSSAVRHASWTMVLCAMLVMPLLPSVVPGFSVPLPASVAGIDTHDPRFDEYEAVGSSRGGTTFDTTVARESSATPPAGIAPHADQSWANAFAVARSASARLAAALAAAFASVRASRVMAALYVVGVSLLLLRLFAGWLASSRLRRTSGRVDNRFHESSGVTTPVTVGAFRPRIILPTSWREWPDDKLHAVLAHELAHVRRRDPLVALLAAVNHALFWFHPVAWWLRRTLAVSSEHACDEAAVLAIRNPRRYAEVLIDMADAVRRGGGRVSWQIGVGGTGTLGQRIDRILRGASSEISRARKTLVVTGCVAAIAVVVACRRDVAVRPLQADPADIERRAKNAADAEFYKAVRSMTFEQAQELQALWRKNPDDLLALRKLLSFYNFALRQKDVKNPQALIDGRRPVVLWTIEHLPEHDLALSVRLAPTPPAWPDPEGYAEARRLWLAHASRPDVTSRALTNKTSFRILINAGAFFSSVEPRLAEDLYLRGQLKTPLGQLYSRILESKNQTGDKITVDATYAKEVREKLTQSANATVLKAAGSRLAFSDDPGLRELGTTLVERSLALNPQDDDARETLAAQRRRDADRSVRAKLLAKQIELAGGEQTIAQRTGGDWRQRNTLLRAVEYDAFSTLSDAERFGLIPDLAQSAYGLALYFDHTEKDRSTAEQMWTHARKYADEGLRLAEKLRDHPKLGFVVHKANMTLGALAMWPGGDKNLAVKHLRAASLAPASEHLAADGRITYQAPLSDLLTYGEHDAVIEYLERMAPKSGKRTKELLGFAAAIREGRAPSWHHPRTQG